MKDITSAVEELGDVDEHVEFLTHSFGVSRSLVDGHAREVQVPISAREFFIYFLILLQRPDPVRPGAASIIGVQRPKIIARGTKSIWVVTKEFWSMHINTRGLHRTVFYSEFESVDRVLQPP